MLAGSTQLSQRVREPARPASRAALLLWRLFLLLFLAAGIHHVLPRFIRQLPGSLGDKLRFIQLLL